MQKKWVILVASVLASVSFGACGGLAGSRTSGDDDDDVSCPAETVGWHVVEHQNVPEDAKAESFEVSTGGGVLSLDSVTSGNELAALHLDLASGRFHLSRFAEMGHLAPVGLPEYAWTGESLVVFGSFIQGSDPDSIAIAGLVYDLSEDRWTRMNTEGQPTGIGCTAWTGTEFSVFAPDGDGPLNNSAYDPAADRWRARGALTVDGVVLIGCQAVWTGDGVFVWAYADQDMPDVPAQFDPEANAWRLLSKDPLVPRRYESKLVFSDGVVFFWSGKDPAAATYTEAPPRRYMVDTDTWLGVTEEGPEPEGHVDNVAGGPEGILLQGAFDSPENDFGFLYVPKEDRWFTLQQGCAAREYFFGDLVWTDYGVILWRGPTELGEPIAWRYEGPLR